MASGLDPNTYNWSVTSGYQSALTGILAGFAFTAVLLILSQRDKHDKEAVSVDVSYTVLSLCAVFFTLVIASYLYASISGYKEDTLRAAIATIWPSVVFCLGAVLMFLTMVWFLSIYEVPTAIGAARLMFYVALIIAAFGIFETFRSAAALTMIKGKLLVRTGAYQWRGILWALPIAISLPVGLVLRPYLTRPKMLAPERVLRVVSVASVIMSALAAVYSSVIDEGTLVLYPVGRLWAKLIPALFLGAFFFCSILALPRSRTKMDGSRRRGQKEKSRT